MRMNNARQALAGFVVGLLITRLALPARAEEAPGAPTRAASASNVT